MAGIVKHWQNVNNKALENKILTITIMAELKQMAVFIANLTIKEAIELANILKDEYGIEPAAAAVAAVAAPTPCSRS